jgi:hypothetical protein
LWVFICFTDLGILSCVLVRLDFWIKEDLFPILERSGGAMSFQQLEVSKKRNVKEEKRTFREQRFTRENEKIENNKTKTKKKYL